MVETSALQTAGRNSSSARVQLAFILAAFLLAQGFKLLEMAPAMEMGGDAVVKWFLARDLAEGDFSTFHAASHHHLRWATWLPAYGLIRLFSDHVTNYFLATAIPSVLAGLVFITITGLYIGPGCALVFAILWWFDVELFRATFQLLPTGAALLPLAVLLLSLILYMGSQKPRYYHVILIFMASFWLYGAKETNLFFVPAVLVMLWIKAGMKDVIIYSMLWVGGYVGEMLAFHALSDNMPTFGRLHSLLAGGRHMTIMLNDSGMLERQAAYFDSGITMRLYKAYPQHSALYFVSFLAALFIVSDWRDKARYQGAWPALMATAFLFTSYTIITLLFVISLSPIRLGQSLQSRYLAVVIPLCYILCLSFVYYAFKKRSWVWLFAAMCVLPFYLGPSINKMLEYLENGRSIEHQAACFREFAGRIDRSTCVRTRTVGRADRKWLRFAPRVIPKRYRTERINRIVGAKIEESDGKLWKKLGEECRETVVIPPICAR